MRNSNRKPTLLTYSWEFIFTQRRLETQFQCFNQRFKPNSTPTAVPLAASNFIWSYSMKAFEHKYSKANTKDYFQRTNIVLKNDISLFQYFSSSAFFI